MLLLDTYSVDFSMGKYFNVPLTPSEPIWQTFFKPSQSRNALSRSVMVSENLACEYSLHFMYRSNVTFLMCECDACYHAELLFILYFFIRWWKIMRIKTNTIGDNCPQNEISFICSLSCHSKNMIYFLFSVEQKKKKKYLSVLWSIWWKSVVCHQSCLDPTFFKIPYFMLKNSYKFGMT